MYTLYTDKSELFEAAVSISGASLNDTKCRLMIESALMCFVFNGTIDSTGACSIPIRSLAKFLPEGSTGKMKLEVIAENTLFVPWESDFIVDTDKKVTVEVVSHKKAPILVEATAVEQPASVLKDRPLSVPPKPVNHSKYVARTLAKKSLKQKISLVEIKSFISAYADMNELSAPEIITLHKNIGKDLKHSMRLLKESNQGG